MSRLLAFAYGIVSYVVFLVSFLYAIGFVANAVVPKSIDSGAAGPAGPALAIDLLLLGLFAVQHSVMARPWFKRWWTRLVPKPVERSTFVLLASLVLLLLYWQWRPLPEVIWLVEGPGAARLLWILCALGWTTVLVGTFLINHFDLFGLRQVELYRRGRPYTEVGFRTPWLYRLVRHPIMLGFLVAFWSTPRMTRGHLLFSVMTTAYILVAIRFEEHDIARLHGAPYEEYRRRVPRLLPLPGRRSRSAEHVPETRRLA